MTIWTLVDLIWLALEALSPNLEEEACVVAEGTREHQPEEPEYVLAEDKQEVS